MEGGEITVNTSLFTNSYESTCGSNARSPEVPIALELTAPAAVTATITSATFDTVLHAVQDNCDLGPLLACDDDSAGFSDGFGRGYGGLQFCSPIPPPNRSNPTPAKTKKPEQCTCLRS